MRLQSSKPPLNYGKRRADELAYDSNDEIILAANTGAALAKKRPLDYFL
jgi:hypothetical protein